MHKFQLDSRLAADTVFIIAYKLCDVRLMNDTRWPWLILVPRLEAAKEIHALSGNEQAQISTETAIAARVLNELTGCTKINTAAIGNIVRQLHIHVIARSENDANWPGPVWGYGERQGYDDAALADGVRHIQKALSDSMED